MSQKSPPSSKNHFDPQLQARLARLASFPEHNTNPVLEVCTDGRIEYINPSALRLFPDLPVKGLEHPYLAGWDQIVEKVSYAPALNTIREIVVDEHCYQQTILYDKQYDCLRIYGQDITENKQSEQALQKAKDEAERHAAELNTIFDSMEDIVMVYDSEGRLLRTNSAFKKFAGMDPDGLGWEEQDEMVLNLNSRFPDGQQVTLEDQIVSRVLCGEMVVDETFLMTDYAGRDAAFNVTSSPIIVGGKIVGAITTAHNITEHNKMEEALHQSQALLQAIIEGSPDPIFLKDRQSRIILANPAVLAVVGKPAEQVIGKNDAEFYDDPAIGQTIIENDRRIMEAGQTEVIEERVLSPEGERIYLSTKAPWRDSQGQVTGLLGLARDITERKQFEAALQKAKNEAETQAAELNAVFDAMKDKVLVYDSQARLVHANTAVKNFAGMDPTGLGLEAISQMFQNQALRHPDGQLITQEERPVTRVLRGEMVVDETYLINDTAGNATAVAVSSSPIRVGGELVGAVTVSHDITERNQREAELRKLNRTLRAISNSNQAMMRAEVEADFMGKICQIIVEDCGHAMVWIGFAEQDEAKTVRPVASAGFEAGYLETLQITWADTERGRGPTGTAIRTGKPSMCRNMLTDPMFEPWRANAIQRGYASSIVLPLLAEEKAFGALTIYSREPDPFTEEEVKLLSELASDLAYGITSIRLRAAHARAEAALSESEEKYRHLMENVNDLVCEVDGQARYMFVNAQYEQLLGYTSDELLGHYVRELIHPEDLRHSTPAFRNLLDGRTISRNEWRFKHKDGEWRWFDCMAQTFERSPGEQRVVVISRDVTERRQMEERLLQSEERYRTLFSGMTEGFALHEIICDEDGRPCDYRFLEINPAFERLTGFKQELVVGKLLSQVLPDDDPKWVQMYGEVALTGQPVHFENYSPGLQQYYEVFAYRPAPMQFAVIFMNVTERKQAEEALQKAHDELEQRVHERTEDLEVLNEELRLEVDERERAEEIIRQSAQRAEILAEVSHRLATAGLDLQKVCDVVSQSIAERIGGICSVHLVTEDGQGFSLASLHHPDPKIKARLYESMAALQLRAGPGFVGSVIKTRESLIIRDIASQGNPDLIGLDIPPTVRQELQISSLLCVPLGQDERVTGVITLVRSAADAPYTEDDLSLLMDLADRASLSMVKARLYQELESALEREHQTRSQLIQAEKNSALARMVASVAHEINNPVQTIKNCMYLLKSEVASGSQADEFVDMAASEANRVGDLVGRLRELYRPSKERDLKPVSVIDVLNNVKALLAPHLLQNKTDLVVQGGSERLFVTGIADQFKQVFLNISLNAIDAMQPEGGCLVIQVTHPTASQVCISFKDTGKGISPDEMQHIFEPLFTTKEKGTGLGLSICNEIVKNHNGSITVESQSGEGAKFSVWLPTTQPRDAAAK